MPGPIQIGFKQTRGLPALAAHVLAVAVLLMVVWALLGCEAAPSTTPQATPTLAATATRTRAPTATPTATRTPIPIPTATSTPTPAPTAPATHSNERRVATIMAQVDVAWANNDWHQVISLLNQANDIDGGNDERDQKLQAALYNYSQYIINHGR